MNDLSPQCGSDDHFSTVWEHTVDTWLAGRLTPASMRDGVPDPVDFCVSTVARISDQSSDALDASGALNALVDIQDELRSAIGDDQFFYPTASLHITLLGCTQRDPDRAALSPERVTTIETVSHRVLDGIPPLAMSLHGVNVMGNQLFIEVVPETDDWASLRTQLAGALRAIGESPITYADTHPIHLNIARITRPLPLSPAATLAALATMRERRLGTVTISDVMLVVTDFVLSAGNTSEVARFCFSGAGHDE